MFFFFFFFFNSVSSENQNDWHPGTNGSGKHEPLVFFLYFGISLEEFFNHSSMQNFSESIILGFAPPPPPSVQTTSFWWDLSLETEMAIAEHGCLFFHLPMIS